MAGKMEDYGRDFGKKLDEITDKAGDLKIAAQLKGIDTHDAVRERLDDAQGELTAATEQARKSAEDTKSHVSSKLLGAQMTLRAKKDEIAAEMDVRKAVNDQQRDLKQVDAAQEYAEYAINYALMAIEEAKWAVLNAEDKRLDYEEQYGADA